MNTLIDLTGYITDCNLITPSDSFFEQSKYRVSIQPDYMSLVEVEQRVEDLKRINEDPYAHQREVTYNNRDNVFADCSVRFENFKKPRLTGDLKGLTHDSQFIGKYVNVTGNIQVMPDGNAYIGVFQIEPRLQSFDPDLSEMVSDDDW